MTTQNDFELSLRQWFQDSATERAPTRLSDAVTAGARRRRQDPAWRVALRGEAWTGPGPAAVPRPALGRGWLLVAVSLLVLALIAGLLIAGGQPRVPASIIGPTNSPGSSASVAPTASPSPSTAESPGPSTAVRARLGRLAYALDGDIYVADWDGKNAVRIADGLPGGSEPCRSYAGEGRIWSPNGQHLAYRSCPGMVFISDPSGQHVVSFPGAGWKVAWSPDSTRVATWIDYRFQRSIGIYGLDGVRQALITLPPETPVEPGDFDPWWAPDGASLRLPGCSGTCDIPLDGSVPRSVPAKDPFSNPSAEISPDGTRVAYVDTGSLFVAGRDGSAARELVPWTGCLAFPTPPRPEGCEPGLGSAGDPVWSPSSNVIVFEVEVGGGSTVYPTPSGVAYPPPSDIRMVDLATGAVTTLVRAPDLCSPIEFSPDGTRLLFSRTNWQGRDSLWSVGLDGSAPQLLVAGTTWGDWQVAIAGR
jgi:hypothetical protein